MTTYTQQYLLLIDLLCGSILNNAIISPIDLMYDAIEITMDGVTEFHNRKYVAPYTCNAIKEKLPISIYLFSHTYSIHVSCRKLL